MATVASVLEVLERIAPARYAFEFDKVGLQVGDSSAPVRRAVVSLDRSLAAVAFATSLEAELLVSHHPLLFEPLKTVTGQTHVGRTVLALARSGISFVAAHTNWDSARGGVNDALAEVLGLADVSDFGSAASVASLKMVVFVPSSDLDAVIDAASQAGAGEIGLYSRCAYYGAGTGTYLGSSGSQPSVGDAGRVERVDEFRLEMVLRADQRVAVERAVRRAHSYEEPAMDFVQLVAASEQPAGRIGRIAPTSLGEFRSLVASRLGDAVWAWGDPSRVIKTVAVVGGAADGEWMAAQRARADVFVTGEVRQHVALESSESGMAIMAAGHHSTEQPGVVALCAALASGVPDVDWSVFAPSPGFAGRPISGS